MAAVRNTYTNALLTRREIGTVNSQSDTDWAAFSTAEQVDIAYDANARPITQKLSSGGTNYALTQFSYDSLGRSDCVAVRMNPAIYGSLPSSACTLGTAGSYGNDRITQTVYDAASRPTEIRVAVGTADAADERALAYTNNGQVASLLDAENNKTSVVYDGFDRLIETLYPSATKGAGTSNSSDYEQLGYDANSNVTSFRLRNGYTLTYSYDALDRQTVKVVPDDTAVFAASTTRDVYYGYDNLNRMTFARFDSTTGDGVSNSYDALSRLTGTSETLLGGTATLGYAYDLAGNRTQMTYPGSTLTVNDDRRH